MSVKDVGKELFPLEVRQELQRIAEKRPDQAVTLPTVPELPEHEEEPVYRPMLHGPGLDSLAQISVRETPEEDKIIDTAVYTGPNYRFTMIEYSEILGAGLRVSTQKLLDALVMDLTAKNTRGARPKTTTAIIDLEEYMRRCGKPITKDNKDFERKRAKEDLDALYRLSLEWKESTGNQAGGADKTGSKNFVKMRICTTIGIIKNSQIVVNFTPEIAEYLTNSYIMWYPANLLKTDDRNPCTYHIGRKLLIHYNNLNNQKGGTASIISVKALLDGTRDIPSEEEVRDSGRQYYQRRIAPLIKSLNALVDDQVLIKWELCNGKMKPLSKSQQNKQDYDTVIKHYIHFEPTENAELQRYLEQMKKAKKDQPKTGTKQRRSGKQGKD
jgi:hypothetical protein